MRAFSCRSSRPCSLRRSSRDGRTALFARYSVIGSCATALGVLAAALPDFATAWTGCTRSAAMQLMFGLYAVLGLVAFLLYRPLSPAVEMADEAPEAPLQQSKKLVYGMAALFGMDSFGTGFLVQSLLALWLYQAFRGFGDDDRDDPVLERPLLGHFLSCRSADRRAYRAHQHNGVHSSAVQRSADPDPLRAQSGDRNRSAARAQRTVADGRADAGPLM